ncbi:MAG: porin, partial [Pseudomonadota bacterium]|nr:porin [Pseudomonadota bacterium]
ASTEYKPGFRVNDGNDQGTGTSRIGWLGTEDLGGGLKAKFQLEMGLRVDDGCVTNGSGNVCSSGASGGNLFGRNAWLGIQGGLGEVRLGRQVLGSFGVQAKSWVGGSSNGLYEPGALVSPLMGGVRFSNAVKYLSPNMGGFQATVTLAAPEIAGNTNTSTTAAFAPGVIPVTATTNAKAKTGLDLALEYGNGPLYVGFGYNRGGNNSDSNNGVAGAGNSLVNAGARSKQYTLGAAFDFGVVKPFINHTRARVDGSNVTTPGAGVATAGFTDGREKATTIGLRAPIGAATLITSYGVSKTTAGSRTANGAVNTAVSNLDGKEKAAQIGVQYPLSKRTLLEANIGRFKNDTTTRGSSFAAVTGALTGTSVTTFNQKVSAVNFGIKHSF